MALGILALLGIFLFLIPPSAMDNNWSEDSTRADANQLATAMIVFQADYGFFPKGSSAEIFSILSGNNPADKPYIERKSFKLSSKGEPLDCWKTPFLFEGARVRSAGRNRMFDGDKPGSDDILSKNKF